MKLKSTNQNTAADTRDMVSSKRLSKFEQLFASLPLGLGGGKQTVAILRLEGVIGKAGSMKSGLTLSSLNKLIEKMFEIDRLAGVCLSINSPGGSPVQSELIASRIRNLAKEKEVPVYSFVEDVAASGGYWLACAGDKIYVSRSSIIGSIGVISSGFGFQNALEKLGIERRVYTQGKTKSVLDPFQEAKESDIKIIKKIQQEIHEHFIDTVKTCRAGRLTQSDDILFNGEFWTGQRAVDYGLADGVDEMYSFIQEQYGENVKIEHIEQKQSWFKKKLGMTQTGADFANDLAEAVIDVAKKELLQSRFDLK